MNWTGRGYFFPQRPQEQPQSSPTTSALAQALPLSVQQQPERSATGVVKHPAIMSMQAIATTNNEANFFIYFT